MTDIDQEERTADLPFVQKVGAPGSMTFRNCTARSPEPDIQGLLDRAHAATGSMVLGIRSLASGTVEVDWEAPAGGRAHLSRSSIEAALQAVLYEVEKGDGDV